MIFLERLELSSKQVAKAKIGLKISAFHWTWSVSQGSYALLLAVVSGPGYVVLLVPTVFPKTLIFIVIAERLSARQIIVTVLAAISAS